MTGIYDALGGREGCRKLSEVFYAKVAVDPILKPLFPAHFRCAVEAFADFLTQFLGGPCDYSERHWSTNLFETHLRFKIGEVERSAWLQNMSATLDDLQIEDSVHAALLSFFQQSSTHLVNDSNAPRNRTNIDDPELAGRWNAQASVEAVVAAIRCGDANRAIKLMQSSAIQEYCDGNQAGLVNILAAMTSSGNPILIDYVRSRLTNEPALARVHYANGRTLLHSAAGAGSLAIVQLLLELGLDPNAADRAGHAPLYSVGNECTNAGGADVVRALVRAGADVNAQDGVKRPSALHMAARRGNVSVAEALLECGANIEARDSLGDSPLRRAVNCGKIEVATLLIAKGADVNSRGSKRKSVKEAARTTAMKQALFSPTPLR